jgi:copper chaperone CopZ
MMAEFLSLTVTGMKCGGCETNIKGKLEALDGVSSVVANHKEKTVELEFEPEKIDEDDIIDVITDAGFKVE